MIDGITLRYDIEDFEGWKQKVNISFSTTVADTGETITKKQQDDYIVTHLAKWQTFTLIVKEVCNKRLGTTVYHLTIKGSLHKSFFGGENYLPFTWRNLQDQVSYICENLAVRF